jgi:hypothetical protein
MLGEYMLQTILMSAILLGLTHACISFFFDGIMLSKGNFPNILWTNNIWRNLQRLAPKPFACSLCLVTWLTIIRCAAGILVAKYMLHIVLTPVDYFVLLVSIPVTYAATLFFLSGVGINDIH